MDALTFVAKFIGGTARVGAGIAFAAIVVFFGRRYNVEFFGTLDSTIYQAIVVAGLIGGGLVFVDIIIAIGRFIRWASGKASGYFAKRSRQREKERVALRNMAALTPAFASTLKFLKLRGMKRFPASASNSFLGQMQRSLLLEIDDPNYSPVYSRQTYYAVPNYVWNAIDRSTRQVPEPPIEPWFEYDDDRI
jgi:hypothetical protein